MKAGKVKGLGGSMISVLRAASQICVRRKTTGRTSQSSSSYRQRRRAISMLAQLKRLDVSTAGAATIAQLKVTLQLAQYPSANAEMMGGLTLTGNANGELLNASILVHVTGLPDLATIEAQQNGHLQKERKSLT